MSLSPFHCYWHHQTQANTYFWQRIVEAASGLFNWPFFKSKGSLHIEQFSFVSLAEPCNRLHVRGKKLMTVCHIPDGEFSWPSASALSSSRVIFPIGSWISFLSAVSIELTSSSSSAFPVEPTPTALRTKFSTWDGFKFISVTAVAIEHSLKFQHWLIAKRSLWAAKLTYTRIVNIPTRKSTPFCSQPNYLSSLPLWSVVTLFFFWIARSVGYSAFMKECPDGRQFVEADKSMSPMQIRFQSIRVSIFAQWHYLQRVSNKNWSL